MKKYMMLTLLVAIIGTIGALDTESYQFIDHLLGLNAPAGPEIIEDGVLFTAPSSYRSVGIAFAHEEFSKIYWFRKLLTSREDPARLAEEKDASTDIYRDSGILFHAYTVPREIRELEYRMIINGLWTVDPANPLRRLDEQTGILRSVILMPEIPRIPSAADGPPGSLSFTYDAPSGESITVAGDFNGWDPFMYELRETSPGRYTLILPVPPGIYHYVFFHRGRRYQDPYNHNKVYTPSGNIVSEAVVH
jgi:hypothetical protein